VPARGTNRTGRNELASIRSRPPRATGLRANWRVSVPWRMPPPPFRARRPRRGRPRSPLACVCSVRSAPPTSPSAPGPPGRQLATPPPQQAPTPPPNLAPGRLARAAVPPTGQGSQPLAREVPGASENIDPRPPRRGAPCIGPAPRRPRAPCPPTPGTPPPQRPSPRPVDWPGSPLHVLTDPAWAAGRGAIVQVRKHCCRGPGLLWGCTVHDSLSHTKWATFLVRPDPHSCGRADVRTPWNSPSVHGGRPFLRRSRGPGSF
jgi:hypothetical protein